MYHMYELLDFTFTVSVYLFTQVWHKINFIMFTYYCLFWFYLIIMFILF